MSLTVFNIPKQTVGHLYSAVGCQRTATLSVTEVVAVLKILQHCVCARNLAQLTVDHTERDRHEESGHVRWMFQRRRFLTCDHKHSSCDDQSPTPEFVLCIVSWLLPFCPLNYLGLVDQGGMGAEGSGAQPGLSSQCVISLLVDRTVSFRHV